MDVFYPKGIETSDLFIWSPVTTAEPGQTYTGHWPWRSPERRVSNEIARAYYAGHGVWVYEGREITAPMWIADAKWAEEFEWPRRKNAPILPPVTRAFNTDAYIFECSPLYLPRRPIDPGVYD